MSRQGRAHFCRSLCWFVGLLARLVQQGVEFSQTDNVWFIGWPLQRPFWSLSEAVKAFKTNFNFKSLRNPGAPFETLGNLEIVLETFVSRQENPFWFRLKSISKLGDWILFIYIFRFIHIYIYIDLYIYIYSITYYGWSNTIKYLVKLSSIMTPQDLGGQSRSIVILAGGQSGGQSRGLRRPPGPK